MGGLSGCRAKGERAVDWDLHLGLCWAPQIPGLFLAFRHITLFSLFPVFFHYLEFVTSFF